MKRLVTAVLRRWNLWRYRHYLELDAPQRPDRMQVMYLKPGIAIRNPLGREPWVLDLVHVSPVAADLMVTLTAVQGQIRVMLDTWADIHTAEDGGMDASVVLTEQQDLR